MRPEEYVSSACRVGEHEECQRHPVVRCACTCHALPPGAAPGGSATPGAERWPPSAA